MPRVRVRTSGSIRALESYTCWCPDRFRSSLRGAARYCELRNRDTSAEADKAQPRRPSSTCICAVSPRRLAGTRPVLAWRCAADQFGLVGGNLQAVFFALRIAAALKRIDPFSVSEATAHDTQE